MTNDSITRLLYAILSQKCLKDIDWNKVAHDPILAQEITNGHAARMRYSRFKKQMDGTSGVRKPRNSSSPRKPKVEKNKSTKKIKERKPSDDDENIKSEAGGAGSSQDMDATPEAGAVESQHASPVVKREPGLHHGYPLTPIGSSSQTPSPGFGGSMSDMDEMMVSFGMADQGMAGEQAMYQNVGVMTGGHGYGMGMPMGMGDPFDELWHQHSQSQDEAGVLVKTEPRWEEDYRQA